METYRLNSRIVEEDKEFLVQTENDIDKGIVRTSIFINGEYVDSNILPHQGEISEEQVLDLVKTAHGEKKSELEFLLKNFHQVLENGSPDMMVQLGKALYYKKMYNEAVRLFRAAANLREDSHEACFFLGLTYARCGNIPEGVKISEEAVKLRGRFPDYRNALGEAYLAEDRWQEALDQFEEAIKRNVYYSDAYFNTALCYLTNAIRRDNKELADEYKARTVEILEKSVLINPIFKTSDYDNAMQAIENDDTKLARDLLFKVRHSKQEKDRIEKAAHFQRYLLNTDWLNHGDIGGRINTLEREITKNPGYVDLYYELAVCRLYQARLSWKDAIGNFEKALKINPDLKKAKSAAELASEEFLKLTDIVYDITEKIK